MGLYPANCVVPRWPDRILGPGRRAACSLILVRELRNLEHVSPQPFPRGRGRISVLLPSLNLMILAASASLPARPRVWRLAGRDAGAPRGGDYVKSRSALSPSAVGFFSLIDRGQAKDKNVNCRLGTHGPDRKLNDCKKQQPLAILGHYEDSLIISRIAFPAKLSYDFRSSYRSHHHAGISRCFRG